MLRLPVGITAITQLFNSEHSGVDFGWVNEENKKIYSSEAGIVNFAGKLNDGCLLIAIYHKELKTLTIYAHCSKMLVKNGDIVTKGQYIGYMGATGIATAVHLHFEIWQNIPDNFQYNPSTRDRDSRKYKVDPLSVTYCYDNQTVLEGSKKYITKYIKGTPIARDPKVDQLEILIDDLNARDNANGKILGYANKGVYNILSSQINGKYTWYQIQPNLWVAYNKDWNKILFKDIDELTKLKKTIQEQNIQIDILATECRKYKEALDEINKISKI